MNNAMNFNPLDTRRGEMEAALQARAGKVGRRSQWELGERWCAHHNCFCSKRTVLSLGKWSVSGSTGHYVVTGPDGWDIERIHPFYTEQEAKEYVEIATENHK